MKKIGYILSTVIILTFISCQDKTESKISGTNNVTMEEKKKGTIMQIVKLKTELSEEELLKIAKEREPQFKAISGIVQKYYVKLGSSGEYGGIYIWDSMESLEKFKKSELAASIPKAYKVVEAPSVEIVDIMFELRE